MKIKKIIPWISTIILILILLIAGGVFAYRSMHEKIYLEAYNKGYFDTWKIIEDAVIDGSILELEIDGVRQHVITTSRCQQNCADELLWLTKDCVSARVGSGEEYIEVIDVRCL